MASKTLTTDQLAQSIMAMADDSKGESITWIDVHNENFPVRRVVLITALNNVHLRALADTIEKQTKDLIREAGKKAEMFAAAVSGTSDSGWIILDFGGLAVHVLTSALRHFYELDQFFQKQGVVYHYA